MRNIKFLLPVVAILPLSLFAFKSPDLETESAKFKEVSVISGDINELGGTPIGTETLHRTTSTTEESQTTTVSFTKTISRVPSLTNETSEDILAEFN